MELTVNLPFLVRFVIERMLSGNVVSMIRASTTFCLCAIVLTGVLFDFVNPEVTEGTGYIFIDADTPATVPLYIRVMTVKQWTI